MKKSKYNEETTWDIEFEDWDISLPEWDIHFDTIVELPQWDITL